MGTLCHLVVITAQLWRENVLFILRFVEEILNLEMVLKNPLPEEFQ